MGPASLDPAVSGRRRSQRFEILGVGDASSSNIPVRLMHAGRQHLCQLPNHSGEIFVHVVATNVDAILLETFEVVLRTFFAKSKQIPGR
jgi:hypothetical protein